MVFLNKYLLSSKEVISNPNFLYQCHCTPTHRRIPNMSSAFRLHTAGRSTFHHPLPVHGGSCRLCTAGVCWYTLSQRYQLSLLWVWLYDSPQGQLVSILLLFDLWPFLWLRFWSFSAGPPTVMCVRGYDCLQQSRSQISGHCLLQCWSIPDNCLQCGELQTSMVWCRSFEHMGCCIGKPWSSIYVLLKFVAQLDLDSVVGKTVSFIKSDMFSWHTQPSNQ